MSELLRIKAQLSDQEAKWRKAYETVVRENELLRTRGGEALLAAQWRERYEVCVSQMRDLRLKLVFEWMYVCIGMPLKFE